MKAKKRGCDHKIFVFMFLLLQCVRYMNKDKIKVTNIIQAKEKV